MKLKFMNSCKSQLAQCEKPIINCLTRFFRWIFPYLRVLIGLCNFIFILSGILMLLTTLTMYCVPAYHVFVDSLKYLCNVKMVFGSFVAMGLISTVVGVCGIHFLRKRQYDKLGLQAASFLILLIVLAAISFTFYTEWNANAHFGMSYATQSYDPEKKDHLYLSSIQHFMKCCGALGPEDYDIANEYFKHSTVPISCCDIVRFPLWCRKTTIQIHKEFQHSGDVPISSTKKKNKKKMTMSIPMNRAFPIGCQTKMEVIIWPIVVWAVVIQGSLCLSMLVVTAVSCGVYHACVKPTEESETDSTHDEAIKTQDEIAVIGGVCRDHTSMELLSHCTTDEQVPYNSEEL